jgi:hypothetical protein
MSIRAYYRDDLALAQLEIALRLFNEGDNFASVITLAGAADEIFGKLLVSSGKESSLEVLKKAVVAIHQKLYGESIEPSIIADRINKAKNSLKHWDSGQDLIIKLDLAQEAKDMLFRAIDNYWALEETLTPMMEQFQRENMNV